MLLIAQILVEAPITSGVLMGFEKVVVEVTWLRSRRYISCAGRIIFALSLTQVGHLRI